jgi:NADPH:quinone reductase-like Zn-dependent oxidoreductase
MKAAVHAKYGPPEVVRIAEVYKPTAADNEVLVKVHVATVNRTDCGFRAGKPFFIRIFSGLTGPKATVLGCEFAGVVEAIGSEVTTFQPGDKVFGYSEWRFGAHAEYLTFPEDGPIATMPENVTFEQAAASTEGSHYAISLIRKAQIQPYDHVMVNGATGAIGSAAVQILKDLGARVVATCDTEHVGLVTELGADRVIDYTAADFTQDDQEYDFVIDAVGKSSFSRCKRLLKPGGIYLSSDLGPLSLNPILALTTRLFGKKKVMFPIPPKFDQKLVKHFKDMLESGAFKPLIDRRYHLEQIAEAYAYVETGKKIGNVLISIEPVL